MEPPWTIREGGVADRAVLRAFHRSLYKEHRDRVLAPEVERLVAYREFDAVLSEDVDALLQRAMVRVFIAEIEGKPVGYITGHVEDDERRVLSPKGVIEDWYVVSAHRGGGVGRALMASIEAAFVDAGCALVESSTWESDEGAREAHRALGYHGVQVVYRKPL